MKRKMRGGQRGENEFMERKSETPVEHARAVGNRQTNSNDVPDISQRPESLVHAEDARQEQTANTKTKMHRTRTE